MISQVKHVIIPVKDQDKALKFYTDKLGFKLLVDAPFGPGLRWIELQIPGADTQIVLFTPEGHEDRVGTSSSFVFSCADVKKTYDDLSKKGVEFLHPPKKEFWGSFTLFKDVDGNTFCLSSS
jgi:catechol 2,3-dioxygenase-like lactoylglutathione lyase family enzyme